MWVNTFDLVVMVLRMSNSVVKNSEEESLGLGGGLEGVSELETGGVDITRLGGLGDFHDGGEVLEDDGLGVGLHGLANLVVGGPVVGGWVNGFADWDGLLDGLVGTEEEGSSHNSFHDVLVLDG